MDWNVPASVFAMRIGERLRTRRTEAMLSITDVASALGKSEPELENIEAGQSTLSAAEIITLCRLLKMPPSWFFDGLL